MTDKTKKIVDWEAMEPHYRAGVKSLAELAEMFGCSDAAVVKHAKKHGWVRDKGARVKALADQKVRDAEVSDEVRTNQAQTKAKRQDVVIEAEAEAQASVRIRHRKDLKRLRDLFDCLLAELVIATGDPTLLREFGELMRAPDDNGQDRRNDLYQKVIGRSARVEDAKKLTDLFEKLVRMEREAFGIDREEGSASPLDELLKKIAAERQGN